MSSFKKVAVILVICSLIFTATSCGGGMEKRAERKLLEFAERHTDTKYYADELEAVQVATKTKDEIVYQVFIVEGTVLSGEEKNKVGSLAGWNTVKIVLTGFCLS